MALKPVRSLREQGPTGHLEPLGLDLGVPISELAAIGRAWRGKQGMPGEPGSSSPGSPGRPGLRGMIWARGRERPGTKSSRAGHPERLRGILESHDSPSYGGSKPGTARLTLASGRDAGWIEVLA